MWIVNKPPPALERREGLRWHLPIPTKHMLPSSHVRSRLHFCLLYKARACRWQAVAIRRDPPTIMPPPRLYPSPRQRLLAPLSQTAAPISPQPTCRPGPSGGRSGVAGGVVRGQGGKGRVWSWVSAPPTPHPHLCPFAGVSLRSPPNSRARGHGALREEWCTEKEGGRGGRVRVGRSEQWGTEITSTILGRTLNPKPWQEAGASAANSGPRAWGLGVRV